MKFVKAFILPLAVAAAIAVLPACKAKKAVVPPPPPPKPVVKEKPAPPPPKPAEEKPAPPPPAPAPPNYNFSNIQFEFDSGILKTESYPALDNAAAEIKKDQSVKFLLGGHSSNEGSDAHNMQLSIERANSVKTYLVNSGVNGSNLTVQGYGESKPITTNTDEASRAQNRRVEIKKQ
ncbi:MAG: OmpA family protein [Sphingobacteriaceae bacterium]|nr:MAG: OmpA family protein [Sphingobacteriaceae bacterium]